MKVLKASAGSGKTYRLSNSYIDLLLASEDRYAYRHILAVTFTNKATAEMKSRILKDLEERAAENPKARQILSDILHDYSAFSVSTIDKFFQRTLKAFAREIGQFSSYQIDLDRKSLISESMDRILDNLTEDQKELVGWLKESMASRLAQGEKASPDKGLYEIGELLKKEEYRKLKESLGLDEDKEFSKERLKDIREACLKVIREFHKRVNDTAKLVEPAISVTKSYKNLLPYLKDFKDWDVVERPRKTLCKACEGSFFLDCFEEPFIIYNTARNIEGLIYSLGIAGEFQREFNALLKEKNVLPLDESNTILRDVIDGSDAPFVYEKMGVRYNSFLLDEFQDTSGIQWENFLPLLKESEAGGGSNLIVGDVKQSIYRFRDSDWTLLGKEVKKEFPTADEETLDCNWRSDENIVNFNNGFFKFAAKAIGQEEIYSDVEQKIRHEDEQKGFVRVSFLEDQKAAVVESVRSALDAGARPGEIAILVRGKEDGKALAAELIKNHIDVISDEALAVKGSTVVNRLVSVLYHIDNPENRIGSFLAEDLEVECPEKFHSLYELCEGILRSLREKDEEAFKGETLFIEAFLDEVQNWVGLNGNKLNLFLKHWSEIDPAIGSPESSNAVRIMTIHKSKGLQFPYVIFPFADKVERFHSRDNVHWCSIDTSSTALGEKTCGIYPTVLSEKVAADTMFADDLEKDRMMQDIDNINIFYVALTRAENGLHIISKPVSKTFRESLDKDMPEYKRFSETLYHFGLRRDDWSIGEMYDFSKLERKERKEKDWNAEFTSFPTGDRLKASEDTNDFFGEDGVVGAAASARLCGIELHALLAAVGNNGRLPSGIDEESRKLLESRIQAHPEWFGEDKRSRNETWVFDEDREEYRPDRVVINPDGSICIIDYKFGAEKKSHINQVRLYMELYRRMGTKKISGAVWYVPEDKVVAVE